jgi:hypothetical protein
MGGARRVSPVLLLTQVAVSSSSSSSGAGAGAIVVVVAILYCGGALFSRMGFLFFFPFTAVFFGVAAATSSCKHLVCCVFLEMVMVLCVCIWDHYSFLVVFVLFVLHVYTRDVSVT